jgi:hypothetical protein
VNRCRLGLLASLSLATSLGCFQDPSSMLVPSNPFGNSPPGIRPQTLASYTPATQETAAKVSAIGFKLLNANQQLGLVLTFLTVGSPTPELFHVGTTQIVITEGLVKQCQDEGQLAGLLSLELGKMVSDREAQAGLQTRNPNREPPAGPGVGMEGGGSHGAADMTQLAEAAPYDQVRKRQMHPPPPPDPKLLAKMILQKAGYGDSELTGIEPVLKTAAENSGLEKQMTQTKSNAASWIR